MSKEAYEKIFTGKKPKYANAGSDMKTADTIEQVVEEQETNGNDVLTSGTTFTNKLVQYMQSIYSFMCVNNDELYAYVEEMGYWKYISPNNNHRDLRKLIPDLCRGKVNRHNLAELYEWLLVEVEQVSLRDLRKSRHYINFRNVAYDMKNQKWVHDRKPLHFRYVLSFDYVEDKESSGCFREFIEKALEHDKDTIREFRKFFALALSNARTKNAFFLYGPSSTGKTTVERLLAELVGMEQCAAVSFSQMDTDFAVATLRGKHLCVSGEVSGMGMKKYDVLKSLCGDDIIATALKNQDYFLLENRAVLVFATNCLPDISAKMEAESLLSRMVIFPFTHVVKKQDCRHQFWQELVKDIPGIVAFAMKGAKDLVEDKYVFHDSARMLGYKQDYAGEQDSFGLFAKMMLTRNPKGRVASSDIDEAYAAFCQLNEYSKVSSNKWPALLRRDFMCQNCYVKSRITDKRVRGYAGVDFKEKGLALLQMEDLDSAYKIIESMNEGGKR